MELNLALLTIGIVVLLLGLLSGWMRQRVLSEPAVALALGIVLGPAVTGLLDVRRWGDPDHIMAQATRITLGISVMGVALRIARGELRRHLRSLLVLLGLVMPLMWAVSAGLALSILAAPLAMAALTGAALTPTDPVVASSIVTGRFAESQLPGRLRLIISAESGANDGLSLPLVAWCLMWTSHGEASGWPEWLVGNVLIDVGGAVVFGGVLGFAAGRFLEWALAREEIETTSRLGYTLALTLVALGGASVLDLNEIFAVFVTGLSFDNAVREHDREEEEGVQEAINRFFMLPVFVLLGLVLPWSAWMELGWRGPLLALAVLILRRLPAVLMLRPLLPSARVWSDALFVGWFGPIGVAALFYGVHAKQHTGESLPWTVASLVVVASVLVHGLSAAPLTRWHRRRRGGSDDG